MGSVGASLATPIPALRIAKRLQRPIMDPGVVIKFDLPSADTTDKTPAVFVREIPQLGI